MMNEERRDASFWIGLHKLAEQTGDGMVPELYALMMARDEARDDNVVAFPAGAVSRRGEMIPLEEAGRVLTFRR